MSGERIHRQSAFLWQAALILLPVAVLAVIGWASLRQDKILAENDARKQAQVIADQLAPAFWTEFVLSPENESNQVAFEIDPSGNLLFPPRYDATPAPAPLDVTELSPEQARLWNTVQSASGTNAAEACRQLIDSEPPKRFAAAAQYQLGILSLQQRNQSAALKTFDLLVNRYPNAVGESGLPLQPLAEFKLHELGSFPTESLCSNLVYQPTALTPFLLAQIESARTNQSDTARQWQAVWAAHERVRDIFAAASDRFRANAPFLPIDTNQIAAAAIPSIIWFTMPRPRPVLLGASHSGQVVVTEENWIATRANAATNRFVCRPESDWGERITKDTEHVPLYFSVGVDVGGKRILAGAPDLRSWHYEYVQGGKGGGQDWQKKYSDHTSTNLLASAGHFEDGAEPLKVSVYLANPDELFAAQRSRVLWFGSLVVVSTLAALIGLAAAWRAFQRQLRLNDMKSNFVSSVSHELRAPIASVRLMAESLERGKINEAQKQNEYFRFIVQECRRLSSLIENVLDFSRIEQGRKQYEFEPTDLLALTRETVKLMEPYAEEKGVRLQLDSKLETPNSELNVDGRAIQQALVNLIDNAIKHSAKGQTVTIGLARDDRRTGVPPVSIFSEKQTGLDAGATSVLQIYVEDDGPGIPPAEQQKIFERFYRLGSELRRETQGVGIGLSIVKHIVAAHGGHVTVRSNTDEGSRFTIELPLTRLNK